MGLHEIAALLRASPDGPAAELGAFLEEEMLLAGTAACESVQTEIKYAGYLVRQRELVARTAKLESTALPPDMDYATVVGLSREVTEKLGRVRPLSLGQAGRISGVTPAAVACLEIHLHKLGLLYQQGGQWQGKQLLDPNWVRESGRKQVENEEDGYGYLFWRGKYDSYRADGLYGQYSVILPAQEAVITCTAENRNQKQLLETLLDAIVPQL